MEYYGYQNEGTMHLKFLGKCSLIIFTLVTASLLSISNTYAQTNLEEIIQQSDHYSSEEPIKEIAEITQVNRLRDVSRTDWAYEALRGLVADYNCISGFPGQTYRGSETVSRYEFAAGLNSCIKRITSLIDSAEMVVRQDIEIINRLAQDFALEIAELDSSINNLELRTAFLKDHQFSTTTILEGEIIFGLGSVLAGSKDNGEQDIDHIVVFGNDLNLELETSFTGKDALSIELEAVNFPAFSEVTGTFQGELSFGGSNENNLELDELVYSFPWGDNLEVIIAASGLAADDIAETINFLESDNGGNGALSNFGGLNPIYETAEDAGLGLIYELGETVELSAGYLASPVNEPNDEGGIFNAPYGAIGQIIISPSDRLNLAVTYIHSRDQSDTDAGSNLANLQSFTEEVFGEAVPTVSDSYGVELSWELSEFLVVGSWGGFSKVTTLSTLGGTIDRGTQDIWNWAVTLAFRDLGQEGNLGGIVVGMEPWVTSSSINSLGKDENLSWHIEAFYQYKITDYISVTPGIVWITAPNNNNNNEDLVIGAIRTTFTF
ncbi:MAG: iron uptake porin [Xenococcus sp. MO_188.B8]|nr:iron uptake porin [Xenococcus sp. MO_188.B8]